MGKVFSKDKPRSSPKAITASQTIGQVQAKKPAQSRLTEHDKAILDLKKQRDQCKKRLKVIEEQEIKLKNLAKQLMKEGKKQKALSCLKKSKLQTVTYEKVVNILNNVEEMTSNIETQQMNIKIAETLKTGSAALKDLQKLCSVEDVEKILDEAQEGIDKQNEIDQAFANVAGADLAIDEDDLWSEFVNDLEANDLEKLEQAPEVPNNQLPEIPATELDQNFADQLVEEEREAVLA